MGKIALSKLKWMIKLLASIEKEYNSIEKGMKSILLQFLY